MQHLRVLENEGIVEVERRGRYRYNHLDTDRLAYLNQQVAAQASATQGVPGQQSGTQTLAVAQPLIEKTFRYAAPVAALFDALTVHISTWWQNDGATVLLEPQLGGRLWKQFDTSGNGVLFGTVDILRRDNMIGIMGTMGNDNALSIIRFRLSATDDGGSQLQLSHQFVGKLNVLTFEAFENSWQDLLGGHLRVFLESDQPSS